MDYRWKEYPLGWLKTCLNWFGALLIVAAVCLAAAMPIIMVGQQRAIETYYHQALQAANPGQFASALRQFDKAMEKAGMVSGNTEWIISGPHNDIAFKRGQFLSLAQRAEALASQAPSSFEVSVGLPDLKNILFKVNPGVYGFWLLQQGGLWLAAYLPVIGVIFGIVVLVASNALPHRFRCRVKVACIPA